MQGTWVRHSGIRRFWTTCLGLFALCGVLFAFDGRGAPAAAQGASSARLLIMGEDVDVDALPRSSRVHARVLGVLTDRLSRAGHAVYDETAASLGSQTRGRVRRADAELIDVARGLTAPPIDAVVVFTLYASTEKLAYTTKIRARLAGRVLQVAGGRLLGSFDMSPPGEVRAPLDCARDCVLDAVGDAAAALAADASSAIIDRLAAAYPAAPATQRAQTSQPTAPAAPVAPDGYTLVLADFAAEEVEGLEAYLVAFAGYRRHSAVRLQPSRREYWYETSADASRLARDLGAMLDHLGLTARVTFAGNRAAVERVR